MNLLSLCSGIGGLDLAAEMTGKIETIAFAEIEPFCCRVLAHHWPDVPNLGDIHGITKERLAAVGIDWRAIDIVGGGIPCQGNSVAGARRGRADERNLWPATAKILREIHPRWFVLENVRGILSASTDRRSGDSGVFGDILRDLADLGYTAGWMVYGAIDMGAPHQRDRVILIARLADTSRKQCQEWTRNPEQRRVVPESAFGYDSGGRGQDVPAASPEHRTTHPVADSDLDHRRYAVGADAPGLDGAGSTDEAGERHQQWPPAQPGRAADSLVEYADGAGREEQCPPSEPGSLGHADRRSDAKRRKGQVESRLGDGAHGLSHRMARYTEWHGFPSGPQAPQYFWEPPRTTVIGSKDRVAKLAALGNAIMPQQLYPVFAALVESEEFYA